MPLDGELGSLHNVVKVLGITPLPKAVLDAHKVSELRKHPAHWLIKYKEHVPEIMAITFIVSFLGGIFVCAITIVLAGLGSWWGLMTGLVALCCLTSSVYAYRVVFGLNPVKDEPYWIEISHGHDSAYLSEVPEPIMAIARRIDGMVGNTYLIIGKLYQNDIVLDPYLIVCQNHGSQRHDTIIGIWNDDKIIHIASVTE
jgi:hypothetical protein